MQFGLFYEWPNPDLRDWRVLFEEGVEQIQYSETLGFDYCLIAEHHFTTYGNSPAPLLQALHIGQRTRRIGIGTASVILPMWQPLRLAEEVAVLDNLLDGRFMCGVGRGYQPYEMAGFGADVGESRARFDETLDVLLKAWTSDESFTYQGEYVNIEHPVTVFPKPLQKPHPPLMITGSSVDSMRTAARYGMLPFTSSQMGLDGGAPSTAYWPMPTGNSASLSRISASVSSASPTSRPRTRRRWRPSNTPAGRTAHRGASTVRPLTPEESKQSPTKANSTTRLSWTGCSSAAPRRSLKS